VQCRNIISTRSAKSCYQFNQHVNKQVSSQKENDRERERERQILGQKDIVSTSKSAAHKMKNENHFDRDGEEVNQLK